MFSKLPIEIQEKIINYTYELEISKKNNYIKKYITNFYMVGGTRNIPIKYITLKLNIANPQL